MYEVTNKLSRADFISLIVSLITAAHDHFDDASFTNPGVGSHGRYAAGGIETLGHQLACLFAQRTGESVGTAEAIDGLYLFEQVADLRGVVDEFLYQLES